MPARDDFDQPTGPARDRILGGIVAEGGRRVRRRHRLIIGSGALVALAIAAVVIAVKPGSRADVRTTSAATSPTASATTVPATTTSAIADTTSTAVGAATSTTVVADAPAGSTDDQATTTVPLRCVNNMDNPACGPLAWQPDPGPNEPITLSVSVSPAQPKAGDDVTFTITAQDPDQSIACLTTNLDGWSCLPRPDCSWKTRYGPWQTPAKPITSPVVQTRDHVFANPGTYQVIVQTYSGVGDGCEGNSPWDSDASTTITVLVT